MAVLMRFMPSGFTAAQYSEVIKRLEAAGAGHPPGRLYHVCFGDEANLRISDIWDSRENFEKFFETVGPIMQDLGVGAAEPEFLEVHNTISGEQASSSAG